MGSSVESGVGTSSSYQVFVSRSPQFDVYLDSDSGSPYHPGARGHEDKRHLTSQLLLSCVTLSSGSETGNPSRLEKNLHIQVKFYVYKSVLHYEDIYFLGTKWEFGGKALVIPALTSSFTEAPESLRGTLLCPPCLFLLLSFIQSVFVETLINGILLLIVTQEPWVSHLSFLDLFPLFYEKFPLPLKWVM